MEFIPRNPTQPVTVIIPKEDITDLGDAYSVKLYTKPASAHYFVCSEWLVSRLIKEQYLSPITRIGNADVFTESGMDKCARAYSEHTTRGVIYD